MRCADCRWWVETVEAEGLCHRNPPQVISDREAWPTTAADDFCGEFNAPPADFARELRVPPMPGQPIPVKRGKGQR